MSIAIHKPAAAAAIICCLLPIYMNIKKRKFKPQPATYVQRKRQIMATSIFFFCMVILTKTA